MMILAPSILSANFAHLGADIAEIERAGVKYVHIDVMDGHFVPNISFGIPIMKSIRPLTDMVFDVHLMISNPASYIEQFAEAGADIINFHYEAVVEPLDVIKRIRETGRRCAITIKPNTPVDKIFPYVELVDMVLVMSVEPGFGGQELMPSALDKIRNLRRFADEHGFTNLDIEIDGGVKLDNVQTVIEAGANVIVAGSAVFSGDIYCNATDFIRLFEG